MDAKHRSTTGIDLGLFKRYAASELVLEKGAPIFFRGDRAHFFHILRTGRVKMVRMNEEGKEFVQGYFAPGQSFGEPPFFIDEDYPATAVAVEPSVVLRMQRNDYARLVAEHPEVERRLIAVLSRRLFYKATMLGEIATGEATHRLGTLIGYLASQEPEIDEDGPEIFVVPYTRQQLADMTGLRVETVIRGIKKLEEQGILAIERGKIAWDRTNEKKR
mgnify:CR=1 FL=1